LANAFICTEDDPTSFVVSNGSTHYFHLKASSEVERQKWVTALELVKAKAIKMLESGELEHDFHLGLRFQCVFHKYFG
jgi:ureidoglycolate hydrolase